MKTDEKTMTTAPALEEATKIGDYAKPEGHGGADSVATDPVPPQGGSAIAKKSAAALVPVTAGGIMVRNLEELMRFAAMIVRDGAAPKGMTTGQAAIAIQAGLERGLGLLGGLTQGVVINGVFSWRGQGAIALIQNSGVCKSGTLDSWWEGEGEERKGVAVGHRVGYRDCSRREFSVKDARRAGLWTKSGPWHDFPEGQLIWRAVGLLARFVFPDVLGGYPLYEEAIDFDDSKRGRAQVTVRSESPPPTVPDDLLDAIGGKDPPEPETPAVVDAELVETEQPVCPHGVAFDECEDCAREDKAAVLEAEAEEGKRQKRQ